MDSTNLIYPLAAWVKQYLFTHLPVVPVLLVAFAIAFSGRLRTEVGLPGAYIRLGGLTRGPGRLSPDMFLPACMALVDILLIGLLPVLGLSYGPIGLSLFAITTLRLVATIITILLLKYAWRWQDAARPHPPAPSPDSRRSGDGGANAADARAQVYGRAQGVLWGLNLVICAAAFQGMYLEPFRLQTSVIQVAGPAFLADRPLRIVHISDLHVERITAREREVLARLEDLDPDIIVLTGDYISIDYNRDTVAFEDARQVLSQLHAPYGVYAVRGTPGVDTDASMQAIFHDLKIHVLNDATARVALPGGELTIIGIANRTLSRDSTALSEQMQLTTPADYTLMLYHTPDLIETAAQTGVDLYLAGHTHGGQVRIPFYGAVVTSSVYGRKYASGIYSLGEMTGFISRGVGMEGLGLPRARFFCPPEISLILLSPP